MSVEEIITIAQKIVKHQKVNMPKLESWELGEVLWWIENLGKDLV
ncbi:hypothetical protein U0D24_21950 [Hafnia paralvei]|jgi:hypothetical protein